MGQRTILVVDDEADIREIFKMILEPEGYRVITAANGRDALDQLMHAKVKPDLVILDLMMPVMDGWQFLVERSRIEALKGIPVVVISAFLDRAQPPEATEFLRKPFDVDAVTQVIRKYVS